MIMKSELGTLVPVKDGAFGSVYEAPGYQLRGSETVPLAYKEYKTIATGSGGTRTGVTAERVAALRQAVEFRERLIRRDPRGQAELDRYFAWPWEIVRDNTSGHDVCGFLMPLADADFFWQSGNPVKQPRTLDWLISPERLWRLNGVDLSDLTETDRLFLMAQLVFAVDLLHKRGWVFGDLSFPNGAFALNPPRLVLFDCDDAAPLADKKRKQPHSPHWYPPECEPGKPPQLQNAATDVYKVGLAIIRCLKPGSGAGTTYDVRRLDGILNAEGIDLVTRALSHVPRDRPTAEELFHYLWRFTEPRMAPPRIVSAELDKPLLLRGWDARVRWQIENAEKILVLLGENPREEVKEVTDPAAFPRGCTCPVTRSGQVTVVATSRYGSDERVVGDVALYEIPPFSVDFAQLPRADIPPIQAFPAEFPVTALPTEGFPSMQKIPTMPNLGSADMMRHFFPDPTLAVPRPYIDNAVLDHSHSVVELIHTETENFIASQRGKLENARRKNVGNNNG